MYSSFISLITTLYRGFLLIELLKAAKSGVLVFFKIKILDE